MAENKPTNRERLREITDGIEPVSYTHLDVYKRQAFCLPVMMSLSVTRKRSTHLLLSVCMGRSSSCLLYTSRCVEETGIQEMKKEGNFC